MLTETQTANLAKAEQTAKAIEAHTGLTIQIGYIGNLSERRDDRIWFAWVANARTVNGNMVSICDPTGGGMNDGLQALGLLHRAISRQGVRPAEVTDVWGKVVSTWEQSRKILDSLKAAA